MADRQGEQGGLEGLAALCLASMPLPGFGSLPVELKLKCLASCDWQTLSRVACTSRSARALVSYLVRTPYWRTHSEEQPAVLTTDFATEEEREGACDKWARGLAQQLCGLGKPDLCFVFVSSRSHANLPAMLRALRSHLASCTALAGVVAPGVLGRDTAAGAVREVEGEAENAARVGLVVSVVHLPPGSTVHASFVRSGMVQEDSDADWQPPEGSMPQGPAFYPRTWLVFSDRHARVDSVLGELGQRFPGEHVCGGMGGDADGGPSLIAGLPGRGADQPLHAELTSGTLLLSISGPGVVAVPLSARGMRCISQRFMVSQVSPNVDMPPVGRVTLVQQLQNSMMLTTKKDTLTWVPVGNGFTPTSALVSVLQAQGGNVAPRAPLFFGVRLPSGAWDERDPCRMIMLQMHDPNNLMRTSGYVSVQHQVESGMLSAFFTPMPDLSRRQLEAQLGVGVDMLCQDGELEEAPEGQQRGVARRSGHQPHQPADCIHTVLTARPSPVTGCLLFTCVAKGQRYYEEPGVESGMVGNALPGAALAGFFCNGEIGPAPPDELSPHDGQSSRMMGYSTVACLLKLIPGPPPPAEWMD